MIDRGIIDDLIGLPYLKGGRGPDAYDCWGLCEEVCRRAGVEVPSVRTPPTRADRNDLFCSTKEIFTKVSRPSPWCLAAFRVGRNWHAGVVLPGLTEFIHVTGGIRVTISQLHNCKWRRRFDGFYIFPNNADS